MEHLAITVFIVWMICVLINLFIALISNKPYSKDEKLMTALLILAGPLTIAIILIMFFIETQNSSNERN